jgi:hypothetical protein
MGAYWRVILPLAINLQKESPSQQKQFVKNFSHLFELLDHPTLSLYVPKADVHAMFFDFYRDFLTRVFEKSRKLPMLFNADASNSSVDALMSEFQKADVFDSNAPIKLSSIHPNYYLHHVQIMGAIVYEGYPFGQYTIMNGLSLLVSGWKYGEDSAVILYMRDVMDALRDKYPAIVELLFICAY